MQRTQHTLEDVGETLVTKLRMLLVGLVLFGFVKTLKGLHLLGTSFCFEIQWGVTCFLFFF